MGKRILKEENIFFIWYLSKQTLFNMKQNKKTITINCKNFSTNFSFSLLNWM